MWEKLVELCKAIGELTASIFRRILPHAGAIAFGLCLALIVGFLWMWYQGRPPQRITLLTGPSGGAGDDLGKKVANRMRRPEFSELFGRKIEVEVESTQGYEENRQRIDRDQTGLEIGFAHDGFGPPGNVKILLPLNESYVHIIVSKDLWDRASEFHAKRRPPPVSLIGAFFPRDRPEPQARTFDLLASYLRNLPADSEFRHAAFLGPELSGTRQTAEMILRHYGVPIANIDSQANFDWQDMMFSLFKGNIHLGFMTTTPGSETVEKIAHRGGFYLVGLDDVAGIRTRNSHISEAEFGKNSYGVVNDLGEAFCSTPLRTIATRRVIICSKNMPATDGYYLATQIKEAIREEIPNINWDRVTTEEQRAESQGYTFPLHPGSEPIRAKYKPFYARIPGPFLPTLIVLVLSVSAALFRKFRSSLDGEPPAESKRLDPFDEQLQAAVKEISATPTEMKRAEFRKWQTKVRKLDKQIVQHVRNDSVDEKTREVLFQGLGELRYELELRNPSAQPSPQAAPAKAAQ